MEGMVMAEETDKSNARQVVTGQDTATVAETTTETQPGGGEPTNDEKVGYANPPKKSRFRKGKSGNPRGRPKKFVPPIRTNDRDIIRRLDTETVDVQGVKVSKRELELRILHAKSLKGDLRAMKMLDEKRVALKLDQPIQRSGVLVVPQAPSNEEWKRRAALNQAKYREANYSPMLEIEAAARTKEPAVPVPLITAPAAAPDHEKAPRDEKE